MAASKIVVIGSANMDLVIRVPRLPREGETMAGGDLALYPGGKGANQACAVGRLGGNALLIAQLGADPFGSKLLESLEASGVETSCVGIANRPTGCASIYVLPSGENSIVISPGANATLDPDTAIRKLDLLRSGDLVLSQLEIPVLTVTAALMRAKQVGAITVLDPAPVQPLPPELLAVVDYLTPNQTEAAMLLGDPSREPVDVESAARVARELLKLGPKTVVLKLGSLGCLVAGPSMCCAVASFRVDGVDSTAAGDVFNGALAAALAEGKSDLEAATFANAAAAISVTRHGAQSSIPTRQEADTLCKSATHKTVLRV
jgi:ribokinase